MNVKNIFLTSFVSLFGQAIGNSNPITFEFCEDAVVEEVKTEKQRVKITTYFSPTIYARRSPTGKYIHRINVDKHGKTFPIYIASSMGLYTEGFARIELPTETFYLSHDWKYYNTPMNSSGKVLRKGQAASRYYKKGSKFVFKGDTITITDTGSGLSKTKPHIDLYMGVGDKVYNKTTYLTDVYFIVEPD